MANWKDKEACLKTSTNLLTDSTTQDDDIEIRTIQKKHRARDSKLKLTELFPSKNCYLPSNKIVLFTQLMKLKNSSGIQSQIVFYLFFSIATFGVSWVSLTRVSQIFVGIAFAPEKVITYFVLITYLDWKHSLQPIFVISNDSLSSVFPENLYASVCSRRNIMHSRSSKNVGFQMWSKSTYHFLRFNQLPDFLETTIADSKGDVDR